MRRFSFVTPSAMAVLGVVLAATAARPVSADQGQFTWAAGVPHPHAALSGPRITNPSPGIRVADLRRFSKTGQYYSFSDVGSPKNSSSSAPLSFNNAGQMVGTAYFGSSSIQECVVWNGQAFDTVKLAPGVTSCSPLTISNGSTPAYEIGGTVTDQYDPYTIGFVAESSGTKPAKMKVLSEYGYSEIDGLSASNVGVGGAYDRPVNGTNDSYPPFVLEGKSFSLLQPSCEPSFGTLCMYEDTQYRNEGAQSWCAFGGCAINDNNVVLGIDYYSDDLMVETIGQPSSAQDLTVLSSNWNSVTGINNLNEVAYYQYTSSGPPYSLSYQYTVGASAATEIAPASQWYCNNWYPLSQNNLGEVLGIGYTCQHDGLTYSSLYWTWTPAGGMSILNTQIPPSNGYEQILPLGVNDLGQILVQLYTNTGNYDWGMLIPPTSNQPRHGQIKPGKPLH